MIWLVSYRIRRHTCQPEYRNALTEKDPAQWLIDRIKEERKIGYPHVMDLTLLFAHKVDPDTVDISDLEEVLQ